jgi:DNA-binding response OmpR family regulator
MAMGDGHLIMTNAFKCLDLSEPLIPSVLHIEDDDGDAVMVAKSLEAAGCRARIDRVVDGLQALSRFDAIAYGHYPRPDLVLLDLKLPSASGFDVLRRARSYDALSELPIVMFTSSEDEEDKNLCIGYGCTEFAVKPMDYVKYLAVLKGICERYVAPLTDVQPIPA